MLLKKSQRNVIALALTAFILFGMTGCGEKEAGSEIDGKVTITIGNFPGELEPHRGTYDKLVEDFMQKYPDIIVQPDTWTYDPHRPASCDHQRSS